MYLIAILYSDLPETSKRVSHVKQETLLKIRGSLDTKFTDSIIKIKTLLMQFEYVYQNVNLQELFKNDFNTGGLKRKTTICKNEMSK